VEIIVRDQAQTADADQRGALRELTALFQRFPDLLGEIDSIPENADGVALREARCEFVEVLIPWLRRQCPRNAQNLGGVIQAQAMLLLSGRGLYLAGKGIQ